MNPTTAGRSTRADSPLWVSTQATGSFLTLRGLLSFTAILCLAVWFGQEEIAVLASLILASALISRGWSMFSLAGVRAQFLFGERRAFPGDVINGRFRIINRKPLPDQMVSGSPLDGRPHLHTSGILSFSFPEHDLR
jgi:hypothetical protein